jgi:DNA uptake protein ComE-like DNA-binding protein
LILIGGSYLVIRDALLPPAVSRPWRVELLPDYQSPLLLDLNASPVDSLELVPGIGPILAGRIDWYRRTHGPFAAVDSLRNIAGIGSQKLDRIRPYLIVRAK